MSRTAGGEVCLLSPKLARIGLAWNPHKVTARPSAGAPKGQRLTREKADDDCDSGEVEGAMSEQNLKTASKRSRTWAAVLAALLALSGCANVEAPEAGASGDEGADGPGFELADQEDDESGAAVWYGFDPVAAAGDEPLLNAKSGGFPPCGQPMVDNRTGRPLGYQGVYVYSNGACSGGRDGATSCAGSYSDRRPCQQAELPLGPQPDPVAAFDPTRDRSTNLWQCVEFAKRVFARLYRVYGWDGHAYQMLDLAPRGVEVRRQGDPRAPVPGDAVVYGGGYGHVAIVTRVQGDKVFMVGQNEGANFERQATYRNGQLADAGFTSLTVLGWAHATANPNGSSGGAAPSAPAQAPAQAEECNLQHWNCTSDHTARFHCANGRVSAYETCGYTCESQPSGQDDVCVDRNGNTAAGAPSGAGGAGGNNSGAAPPAAAPECRDRDHRYWTCSGDGTAMARCSNEHWEVTQCPNGCHSQWWDDECSPAPANSPAPSGNNNAGSGGSSGGSSGGTVNGVPQGECNYRYWNCTADRSGRFRCAGGRVVDSEACAQGCVAQASGTDDVCQASVPRATPVCTDSCPYAGDGDCDDGGRGSAYNVCELGTDCSDCGRRD